MTFCCEISAIIICNSAENNRKLCKTEEQDCGDAEDHAESLFFGESFLEDDETCDHCEDQVAAVDEGEEDDAGHCAGKVEVDFVGEGDDEADEQKHSDEFGIEDRLARRFVFAEGLREPDHKGNERSGDEGNDEEPACFGGVI